MRIWSYPVYLSNGNGRTAFLFPEWDDFFGDYDIFLQFEDKIVDATDSERHYLLTAIAAMAMSRESQDEIKLVLDFLFHSLCSPKISFFSLSRFVKQASLDIFRIGFVSDEVIDESLAKCSRDLLADISRKHPFIMSMILEELNTDATLQHPGMVSFLKHPMSNF